MATSGGYLSSLALLLGCMSFAQAQDRPAASLAGLGAPVPAQGLAAVRGGFELGDGLEVSFGIQRAIYVDGNLVTYINVSVPDVAHITTQQAAALATALGTVNVQVGAGNTFEPSSTGPAGQAAAPQKGATANVPNAPGHPLVSSNIVPASATQASAATVIQNTVDNQVISSITTLNVAVNALNAMRNQGLQQSLQTAQQLQAALH